MDSFSTISARKLDDAGTSYNSMNGRVTTVENSLNQGKAGKISQIQNMDSNISQQFAHVQKGANGKINL